MDLACGHVVWQSCTYIVSRDNKVPHRMSVIKSQYGKGVEICVSWVQASNGSIPPRAVRAGGSCFVGRARLNGEYVPGKVCEGHSVCYVAHGGREHGISDYEVLVQSDIMGHDSVEWSHVTGSSMPKGAIVAGTDNGAPLFISRTEIDGEIVVGKYFPEHSCAYVPHGGVEHRRDGAEVLCCTAKHL